MPSEKQPAGTLNSPCSSLPDLLKESADSLPPTAATERTFYEHLARIKSGPLQQQLNDLCAVWCLCMGCEWVWLRQFNDFSRHWELFGYAGKNGTPPVPHVLALKDLNSVTEFCSCVGQPEFVDNPSKWSKRLDNVDYGVPSAVFLSDNGCNAFVSIPLLPPNNGERGEGEREASRVICCHYADRSKLRQHPADVLTVRGRHTYLFIASAYESQQRRILSKLTELAAPHIRAQNADPWKNRHDYATKLRDLISEELGTPCVSIFFEDQSGTLLECLASTGLYDSENHSYSNEQVERVVYSKGESRTWQVYEKNEPLVVNIGETTTTASKYQESPFGSVDHKTPWVIHPLPLTCALSENWKGAKSVGVIRCTGHPSHYPQSPHRNFLPTELQLLGQIAHQSSLMLQALSISVFREMQFGGVKHDLLAPMLMVRDASTATQHPISQLRSILSGLRLPTDVQIASNGALGLLTNQIKDINASGFLLLSLLTELDSDPVQKIVLYPEETALAGDIIATMASSLRHYAKETRQMSIEFGNFDSIPSLHIDRFQVWRALGNLVTNAIKYGERGSTIRVDALRVRERKAIVVSVVNYGMGIVEKDQGQIFCGNYRSPEAQQVANGEGWGLKIVQQIMRLHQGEVELTRLKDPTIFSLIFPWSRVSTT